MYEISKKQKIIIAIILLIIIIAFLCYIYTKDDEMFFSEDEVENNIYENEVVENEENLEETKIVVHVSGAVNNEGIVELEQGSRISDAIDKSGGFKEDADMSKINLAFKLEDGMKIYVPTIEESDNEMAQNNFIDETYKYITSSSGATEENKGNGEFSKVNINTATQTELETLPGIGPSTSLKIINYREENGNFTNIDEIKEVSGIGDAKYENIKDLICVD